MVLSNPAKSVLKCGAWVDECDFQSKSKNITISKNNSLLFFSALYHSKKTDDSPPCYCCHLGRHLEYLITLKNDYNMPVKFSKYNRCLKLSDMIY